MGEISVVIPCRDVEADIGDALDSLQSEHSSIAEVICVDDGSSDQTTNVIRSAAKRFDFSISIVEGAIRGAGAARNVGLARVDSPFCQFLDADDLLLPGKLEHQRALLEESGSGAATGAYRLESLNANVRTIAVDSDVWRGLITSRLGATSSMLFRSDDVRAVDGWNEEIGSSQEYDLLFRLASTGVLLLPDNAVLTVKRERPGAISAGDPVARWSRFVELRSAMLTHLADSNHLNNELTDLGHQTIFRAIQKIAEQDLGRAAEMLESELPPHFRPDGSSPGSRLYRLVYSAAGFTTAQRLRRRLETFR